jgi:hypothetical protein
MALAIGNGGTVNPTHKEELFMKRASLLICIVAALALCASAQTYVDFHQMPIANTPAPMPDNYPAVSGLAWDNFYYVTPGSWKEAGPGFWVDPASHHNTVAFMGGPYCNVLAASPAACFGSIKLQRPGADRPSFPTFTPVSISVAAGWLPNNVVVTAYDNSKFLGSVVWNLTTKPQTFSFPATWRVTQLVFTPESVPANAIYPQAGSMVVYSLVLTEP